MKKIILASVLAVTAATPALAADQHVFGHQVSTYAGVAAGYTFGQADTDVAGVSPDLRGWEGGLFIGARHNVAQNWGLGLEAGVDFVNSVDGRDSGLQVQKNHSAYVAVQPFYNVEQVGTVFGTVGYQRGEFEAAAAGLHDDDKSFDGYRLGLGVERDVAEHLAARVEYNYVNYNEKNISGVEFNPSENNLRVGVAYKF